MSSARGIRDPIHGFIELDGNECKIIDSPVFQRLRRIRQLAFAYLVFPGALHTRFDHTLGVFHLADQMARSCGLTDEDMRLVKRAALLHDLGHGPFSHVSEDALEIFADREKLRGEKGDQKTDKIHEMLTQQIIENDDGLAAILGKDSLSEIKKLLMTGFGDPILKSIVSGPLDADKQDYLLRDTYFCGVKYGIFDIERLHRMLTRVPFEVDGGDQLMVLPEGVHTLEQFFLAKYYLTAQVYRHKVRRITDQMVVRAIVLGIDKDNIDLLKGIYAYDGSVSFVENYLRWDDAHFLLEFGSDHWNGTRCREIVNRLAERRLLKQVFDAPINTLNEDCREIVSQISKPQYRENRTRLEESLSAALSGAGIAMECESGDPADYVIAHDYSLKSVRTQSRNDEGTIMISEQRGRGPVPFEDASDLFKSINEKMVNPHFAVYAPITFQNSAARNRVRIKAHEAIMKCLEGFRDGE